MGSYFPSQLELAEGMQPYCQKQKIDGDLCLLGYTATLTAKAMQRAGYSAKDTLALIANNGYGVFAAYERLGMGEMLMPLTSLYAIDGGPEFLIKHGLTTKKDASAFAKLYATEYVKKPKAIDKNCVQKMIPHFRKQAGSQGAYMADDIFAVQAENWCLKNG